MSGNLDHILLWVTFGQHYHPKPYSYGWRRSLTLDVVQQGSSTRGPRVSFVRPGKDISQNTMRYEN